MQIYNRQQRVAGLHQQSRICSCQPAYLQITSWTNIGKPDREYWNPLYYHLQWGPRTIRPQFRLTEDNEEMQYTRTSMQTVFSMSEQS